MTREPEKGRFAREFGAGLLIASPVAVAAMPIGLVFGALAVDKGLSPLEVALMSFFVFAGAAQFVAIDMWTDPAPWLLLGVTTLTVNLRHIMMGASIGRHFQHFGPVERYFYLYFMTDEVWAFSEKRAYEQPLYPAYFAGIAALLSVSWTGWSTAGALLGASLHEPERFGFDFIFTALFIGLVLGFWQGPRTGIVIAVSAIAAIIAHATIEGPWYILAGGAAGTIAGALTMKTGEHARS